MPRDSRIERARMRARSAKTAIGALTVPNEEGTGVVGTIRLRG